MPALVCPSDSTYNPSPINQRSENTIVNLTRIGVDQCEKALKSDECKNVYAEIDKNGGDSKKFKLDCSPVDLETDPEGALEQGQILWGCAMGAFDGTFGWTGRWLGETAAKIVNYIQVDKYCNAHLEYKKMLYQSHNASQPPDLQIDVPSDARLNANSCSVLNRNIYEQSRHLLWVKQNHAPLASNSNSKLGLLKLARQKVKEANVKLECYNMQKSAELICRAAGNVALALAPAAAILKLRLAAGLAAGEDAAEAVEGANLTKSSIQTGPRIAKPMESLVQPSEHAEAVAATRAPAASLCPSCSIETPPLCEGCIPIKFTSYSEQHATAHLGKIEPQKVAQFAHMSDAEKAALRLQAKELARRKTTNFFPPNTDIQQIMKGLKSGSGWVRTQTGRIETLEGPVEIEGKSYRIRVAYCSEIHCGELNRGDVVSIYPTCGPEVVNLVSRSVLQTLDQNSAPISLKPCP